MKILKKAKFKKLTALLLSSMLVLGLVGCSSKDSGKEPNNSTPSNETSKKDSHYPVTIETYNYAKQPVKITFDKAPEKVVAIYQNSIETMLALGLEDKIVAAAGLDHDVKPEFKDAFGKINYLEEFTPAKESIVMLEPDFILGWFSLFNEKRLGEVDYWHGSGVNTYMSLNSGVKAEKNIDNEIIDILNLGKIFNVEDKAQKLVDEINNKVKTVSESVKGQEKQSTIIVEFMNDQISTYGANSLGGDMVTKLGANLVKPDGGKISEEDLVNLNPDSIFVVYMDRSDENVPKQEVNRILENSAFASLKAVKEKRVYAIPLGEMYSSGIRTIDGINTFTKGLYPDLKN